MAAPRINVIPARNLRGTFPSTDWCVESRTPAAWFFALLALITCLRLYVMTLVPLTGDEAYYWQWSRHLDFGYYDHPPLIAWSVALFNAVFGFSLFSTRLAGPFFAAVTTFFIYLLGRDISGSRRTGALSGTVFMLAPLPSIGSMAILPDTPLMAAWAASMYFLNRALFADSRWAWWVAGASLGLGIMSKLTAFFLIPSLFAFLLLSPTHRLWLKRPQPYLFVLTGLLVASPFLLWDAAHGWQTFLYQASLRLRLKPPQDALLAPRYFFDFLAYELVALSPLLFLLGIGVLAYLFRSGLRREPRDLFLATFCACILFFFLAISLRTRSGGHWPLPGYMSLMVGMAWLWQRLGRGYRAALGTGLAIAAAFTISIFAILIKPDILFGLLARSSVDYRGLNRGKQVQAPEMAEIYGYEELARQVVRTVDDMRRSRPTFVITDSYTLSSVLAFYSGLETHVARGSILGGAYRRWDHFDSRLGHDALYVDLSPYGSRPDIQDMLQGAFESIEPEPALVVTRNGQQVRPFYLVRCRGFRRNLLQPQ